MFNETNKNQKIEEILSSLDGVQRAQPSPFFYTRLNARLMRAEKNVWERITSFVARPVVAFAMVTGVILLNMSVLMNQKPVNSASDQTTYQSVYEDYSLASNDFYDYEIKEP